jgi:hypothetical protein
MALSSVSAGNEVQAANINQFKEHLEGGAGKTVTYLLRTTSGADFTVILGGNGTSRKLTVKDSDNSEVFKIDADGNVTVGGSLTVAVLTAPGASSPSQTAAGSMVYNTSSNKLTVGNGSGRDVVSTGTSMSILGTAVMQRFR